MRQCLSALLLTSALCAEPVVITGDLVPSLLGTPLGSLRMTDLAGRPIPFQVDEVTRDGEYVCPRGPSPNASAGNGVLDSTDEIVFLREDGSRAALDGGVLAPPSARRIPLTVGTGPDQRIVCLADDTTMALTKDRYVDYDSAREQVSTPYYYARFGHKRFHFVRAGVKRLDGDGYDDLTKELRIRIHLRTLWGLLPIDYNEENMVCTVKRYKAGPVRLIRRGDFHLHLGPMVNGSRAAVYQICYPQLVRVPVQVHLPLRFRLLFSEAYIEMTPVIVSPARDYSFTVPQSKIAVPLGDPRVLDTLIPVIPNQGFTSVNNGRQGYGWLLQAEMPDSLLGGSGYIVRRPSDRGGLAHCGFRLTIRDLPRGRYLITNWVVFSHDGPSGLIDAGNALLLPAGVSTGVRAAANRIGNAHLPLGR